MNHTLRQRNIDFMKAVRTACNNWSGYPDPTTRQIIRYVLTVPAPRFYVKFETAYRVLTRIEHGGLPDNINKQRRQMWIDIATLVFDYMKTHPGCTLGYALIQVLENETAPSFYMTEWSARSLYYNLIGKAHELAA